MRIAGSSLLLSVVCLSGCDWLSLRKNPDPQVDRPVMSQTPTTQDLVKYLNREASKLQTLESADLYIKVDAPKESNCIPGMKGSLLCQSPRNFRLRGAAFGM